MSYRGRKLIEQKRAMAKQSVIQENDVSTYKPGGKSSKASASALAALKRRTSVAPDRTAVHPVGSG